MPRLPRALMISLIVLLVSLVSLQTQLSGAATTQNHHQLSRQDPRNAHSPLPADRNRTRRHQLAASMRVEVTPMKRSVGNELALNSTNRALSGQKKRFKTSGKAIDTQAPIGASDNNNSTRARELWRSPQVDNDLNNNSIPSDDNNNNNQSSTSGSVPPSWRRNVDSINGTIDLSQYERNDIDRLYGDALLVYFKNFNETLPARRELISINGTMTSVPAGSRNRIPIYRSVPTNEPK